jgi:glutaminyl-tRNA synthetase
VRDDLNENALRRIGIASPIKVIIDNYPEDKEEMITVSNHPQKEELGTRQVPMTREVYIDAEDFAEVPPPKFFRLKPDGEVRLMGGYIIKYAGIEKNEDGSIKCIHATADLETGNGNPVDGRKIKGTIHWLSAKYAKPATVMLYDRLFNIENTADVPEGKTYLDFLNADSLEKIEGAMVEPCLADAKGGDKFQFVRMGYFCKDTKNDDTFNRVVGLKDSFPKK